MKRFRLISAVLILVLLMTPMAVLAGGEDDIVYTALGDSIAFGIGGSEYIGYVDLLNDHLEKVYGESTLLDMSWPGLTSGQLRTALFAASSDPDSELYQAVAAADIISISIGGNDFLQVVAGLNPDDPDIADQLLALVPTLQNMVIQFGVNWMGTVEQPGIVPLVHAMNQKNARIYVNTLYNPLKWNPELQFADAIFQGTVMGDIPVPGINTIIRDGSEAFVYQVVDVYSKFSGFNNGEKMFVHTVYSLDPEVGYLHPTDKGYKFIYKTLIKDARID